MMRNPALQENLREGGDADILYALLTAPGNSRMAA
jgi:hypothetical protein